MKKKGGGEGGNERERKPVRKRERKRCRVCVQEPIKHLIDPHLPHVPKAKAIRKHAEHAPAIEKYNSQHDGGEHGFGPQGESLLQVPKGENAEGLGGDADEEEVGKGEGVVRYEGVLEGADDGDGGVEGVAEEEVAYGIRGVRCGRWKGAWGKLGDLLAFPSK